MKISKILRLVGCGEQDTIPNILTCKVLNKYHNSESVTIGKITFEDIFSANIQKQKQATELFQELIETRNRILNNSLPVACTGPVQSIPILQNHIV